MSATEQFIIDCINYDHKTGLIRWKDSIPDKYYKSHRSKCAFSKSLGKIAGYKKKRPKTNYTEVKSLGFRFVAHRAAWLLYYGYLPKLIDHIDHNGENNKIENLRETCHQGNARNSTLYSTNKSGHVGVSFDTRRKKWKAEICVNYKNIFLGYFETKAEAIDARVKSSAENNFHINHCSN